MTPSGTPKSPSVTDVYSFTLCLSHHRNARGEFASELINKNNVLNKQSPQKRCIHGGEERTEREGKEERKVRSPALFHRTTLYSYTEKDYFLVGKVMSRYLMYIHLVFCLYRSRNDNRIYMVTTVFNLFLMLFYVLIC